MKIDKLVRMVNQIAGFFAHEGPVKAAASTADNLKKFWDPSMRGQIIAAVAAGSATGLEPTALAAVKQLPAPAAN